MKITVVGGGSTYTPELVNGFLARVNSLPITELCLMDIDPQRLEIVGGFAQRMVRAKGEPFKVTLSTVQKEAVAGASYVTTQLRVGMMPARRGWLTAEQCVNCWDHNRLHDWLATKR